MSAIVPLARRLLALAQTGLHFTQEEFDRERYRELTDIATQLLALDGDVDAQELRKRWFVETGYATPKVEVRGAIFRGEEVLMVRERADGKWTVPGGWADVNDTPSFAVEKEILQESGFTARAVKLGALYDRNKHAPPSLFHSWKAFFICEITGGEARTSYETSAVEFFALDALPAELSIGRATAQQIRRMYEHHLRRDLPTDFD